MDKPAHKNWLPYPLGLLVGALNGLFGAGGGMVAVPMLRALKLPTKECHATCIAIILPLACASTLLYLKEGHFTLNDTWIYLPGGLVGALVGAWLLPRLKTVWVRRVFGIVILLAAWRLLSR